jgi:hypothetical protein
MGGWNRVALELDDPFSMSVLKRSDADHLGGGGGGSGGGYAWGHRNAQSDSLDM